MTDLFHGLYVLLWNPTQHILLSEASVIGQIISAPESEVPSKTILETNVKTKFEQLLNYVGVVYWVDNVSIIAPKGH